MTATTSLRIGSITKVFATVAALQMMEGGLVDLDAPISQLISECCY